MSFEKKSVLLAVGGFAVGALALGAVWGAVHLQERGEYGFGGKERGQYAFKNGQQSGGENQQGSGQGNGKHGGGNCGMMSGQGQGQGHGRGQGSGNGARSRQCLGEGGILDETSAPTKELSASAKSALDTAIADEYNARAVYASIIKKFGNIRPFSNIILAEEQHIIALKSVYDRYGVTVPAEGKINVPAFVTKEDACKAGVSAEIANAELYRNTLLPAVSEYPEIVQVFTNLMNASQEKHLPAFERCQ